MEIKTNIIEIIKKHTEHYLKVNGYNSPYDYKGLYDKLKESNLLDYIVIGEKDSGRFEDK